MWEGTGFPCAGDVLSIVADLIIHLASVDVCKTRNYLKNNREKAFKIGWMQACSASFSAKMWTAEIIP